MLAPTPCLLPSPCQGTWWPQPHPESGATSLRRKVLSQPCFMMIDDYWVTLSQCVALSFLNFLLMSFPLSSVPPWESKPLSLLRSILSVLTLLEAALWNAEAKVGGEEVVFPPPQLDPVVPFYFLLPTLHSPPVVLAFS